MLAVLAALVLIPAAQAANVGACGANPNSGELYGPYGSDPTGRGSRYTVPVRSGDLRAVVVRSSKGTTRIQQLFGYDQNIGSWRTLVGSQIILSEDNEYMICIPRRWHITQFSIDTSGGDKAKFRFFNYYAF